MRRAGAGGADRDGHPSRCVGVQNARAAVAGDRVVAAQSFELVKIAVVADIKRACETVSRRHKGIGKVGALNALDRPQGIGASRRVAAHGAGGQIDTDPARREKDIVVARRIEAAAPVDKVVAGKTGERVVCRTTEQRVIEHRRLHGIDAGEVVGADRCIAGGNASDEINVDARGGSSVADDIITGNGNTRLGFNNATAGINVDFVTGIATGDASVGTDHFTGVNAVQASMFDDTLLGGATNDTFTGLAGNDLIDGRGGFDTSSYNNIFFTTGGVTVDMAAGTVSGDASNGTDTLRSIEAIQGTNFADTFVATGYGLAGALNIGNNGAFNQFEGLAGNDTITGNGNTKILFNNATGGVTVHMAAGTADGDASVGHDTFSGVYSAVGSNFADVYDATSFTGTSLGTYNEFQGQGGNDTITGNGNTKI